MKIGLVLAIRTLRQSEQSRFFISTRQISYGNGGKMQIR